ncbi:ABC transporter-like [Arabidopsis suecica]|uniref:ABC transporter-like n=1 Tax=Arabidopsis suecica TaxID=45249 RepID=A0A8T2AI14_ARASU|nr:ABC transporter-like [Arabidopsis suecica]
MELFEARFLSEYTQECNAYESLVVAGLNSTFFFCLQDLLKLSGVRTREAKINLLTNVSGIISPGRLTLLLGPPGCGKTTLLKALSGNLEKNLKRSGEITYNGHGLNEVVPQKTSAYISQHDLHIAEMTVRETIDFSARCQGVGSRTDIMMEVSKREKDGGIIPDPEVDAYMKAISVKGLKRSPQTDYILKILGLDICAETLVGNAMKRGISGGQKKRLTTAEMIVGPTKALFMDEITNGLDSSTAFQIVKSLQKLSHITNATVFVSLLQPAPESYDLFDDIVLMAEGKIVYHGPREEVLEFFEECGFQCPKRKGVADFLQEVISKKDQGQYWLHQDIPHSFVSVDTLSTKFKDLEIGKKIEEALSKPYDKSKTLKDNALSFNVYSLPKWELFRTCISREFLLMKRNYFVYLFKTFQLVLAAIITMTVFIRTKMDIDIVHGNSYMSCLFFATVVLLVDGIPELSMTVQRLSVFYKQKQLCFYPAWAYAIPATVLKVPLSFLESLVWTSLTYYVIGYTPEAYRFFRQFILLFAVHFTSISMFRCIAAIFQTGVAAMTAGSFVMLITFVFAGFAIPYTDMPGWLKWGFWVNPISYAEIGLSVNEFLAPRWQQMQPTNVTLGRTILESRGLNYDDYMYWVSLCALLGLTIIFNTIFTLALSFLKSPTSSRAMISQDKLSELQGTKDSSVKKNKPLDSPMKTIEDSGKMILPFKPLTITFQDLNYYVDVPVEMKAQGYNEKKLQLLSEITGAFRPGVLTALMGISGAGKTTLLDVLAGRKTSGYIEGEIRISGYLKVQETFARVSGYCEQTDIHSPNITVEESLIYSAWLRLVPEIDPQTKLRFVKQVLETIELEEIKDSLVGVAGVSGLSTEQRKRLTVAVELVANPSIIFMDEPTTGLDARAAAIVMRAVKNVADTGRTIVCTIHQPSIHIFEAFDELVLLKRGGRIIYSGPLGQHSSCVIEYFQNITGVAKIRDKYNPATWMLEVTSESVEIELDMDFAKIYNESDLYKNRTNSELVKELSKPDHGSSDLHFKRTFAQNWWEQFKSCLWKMSLSYWRSPTYNLMRIGHTFISSLIFGLLFWNQGKKIDTQQNLFTVLGAIYGLVLFVGINNCTSALQYFETERNVMYRERFAGMYSAFAYALAQVVTEIPYIFIQSAEFVIIIYPMIGFYASSAKVFWSLYAMFCNLLCFNYLAMFLISITPNFMVAAILQSLFFMTFNLFAGFLIPKPQIPKWWVWFYYLTPTSWTLNLFFSSQYGDIHQEINAFGETTTVARFLEDYFGFHHDRLTITAIILIAFPIALATMYAFFVAKLNFQKR